MCILRHIVELYFENNIEKKLWRSCDCNCAILSLAPFHIYSILFFMYSESNLCGVVGGRVVISWNLQKGWQNAPLLSFHMCREYL